MAKKSDKKRDRARAARLPKEIAGIKLPKELRAAGDRLLEKANSPAGREIIASGLMLAATAATAAAMKRRSDADPRNAARPDAASATTPIDASQVADAVGDAAKAVLARVLGTPRAG